MTTKSVSRTSANFVQHVFKIFVQFKEPYSFKSQLILTMISCDCYTRKRSRNHHIQMVIVLRRSRRTAFRKEIIIQPDMLLNIKSQRTFSVSKVQITAYKHTSSTIFFDKSFLHRNVTQRKQ